MFLKIGPPGHAYHLYTGGSQTEENNFVDGPKIYFKGVMVSEVVFFLVWTSMGPFVRPFIAGLPKWIFSHFIYLTISS